MNIKFLTLSFLLTLSTVLPAQNLISNPGFENGLHSWDDLWTRTSNAGIARVVDAPVHSGAGALRITHWGAQDWAFKHAGEMDVEPGEIYTFSAWVNVARQKQWAELSVALFDASGKSIGWSFAAAPFHPTHGEYEKFTTRFAVPAGTDRLWQRFIGGDSCDIYIDDVEFLLTGDIGQDRTYLLENSSLAVMIITPSFALQVQDKRNLREYFVQPSLQFSLVQVDSCDGSYTFHCRTISRDEQFQIKMSLHDGCIEFEIYAEATLELDEGFQFPGIIKSNPDDYLIVPRASGMILPVTEAYPFWDFGLYHWKTTMAFAGVTDLHAGYMVVSDDPWDTVIRFDKPSGEDCATIYLMHEPSKGKFGYPRRFHVVFIDDGGYGAMAKWYRRHAESLGYVKTFTDKIADNPNVERLRGAVDFWALHSHFRQPAFIDSLIHFGVDRAIISLGGGWYNDLDLAVVIDTINARGLLSSRYDIYTDVWPPSHPGLYWYRSEGYPQDVVMDKNGSLLKGWLAYLDDGSEFQGYYTCSATHAPYARRWIADELRTKHYNCRFIDVELASQLCECYSPLHPQTRADDGQSRRALLNVVKNEFQLVTGSEEARDFAFPAVDYGEGTMSIRPSENSGYDWYQPTTSPGAQFIEYNMNPARRIPLHGLVYQDVHVATWYTGDGMSKVPAYWDDKDLFNILYASMPLIMPPSRSYWLENREKFITSMILISAVTRNCGFNKMTEHRFISADNQVQETTFENGWHIVANFSGTERSVEKNVLPGKGFFAANGRNKVYRLKTVSGILAAAELDDRLFLNPYGRSAELSGLKTSGAVLLSKNTGHMSLAFIGNQDYVDFNPSQIPWPLENVRIEGLYSHSPSTPVPLGDGWVRIFKQNQELFYRITGEPMTGMQAGPESPDRYALYQNHPNPFNAETIITYTLPSPARVVITIYDVHGREVIRLRDEWQTASTYRMLWNGRNGEGLDTASGVYFVRLAAGGFTKISKAVLVR